MVKSDLYPAFEKNNVPVVLAVNNKYAPYAGVFIRSLLDHASEENNYDIIILNRDISQENKRLLKSLVTGYTNTSVRFYDPSPCFKSFNYIDEEHRCPLEIFYKLVAPQILNYTGRIITVDIDTLLKTDIARLMDVDLEGCCVGGVSRAPVIYARILLGRSFYPNIKNIGTRDYYRDILGIENYENVESYKNRVYGPPWVFDVDKYIQKLDVETILNTAQQNDYLFYDEDTLYILLKGKIKLLDLAWNVVVPSNERTVKVMNVASKIFNEVYKDSEAYKRAHEDPYLLHWGGRPKPWVCPDVPYGNEWWQTALRTPFVGHIIARMVSELEIRRQYYIEQYGKREVDVWDPTPRRINRAQK